MLVCLPCSVIQTAVVSSLPALQVPFAGHHAAAVGALPTGYYYYPFLHCQDNPFLASHSSPAPPSALAAVQCSPSEHPSWQLPDWALPPLQPSQPAALIQVVAAGPGRACLEVHWVKRQHLPSSPWKPQVLRCWKAGHPAVLVPQFAKVQRAVCVSQQHLGLHSILQDWYGVDWHRLHLSIPGPRNWWAHLEGHAPSQRVNQNLGMKKREAKILWTRKIKIEFTKLTAQQNIKCTLCIAHSKTF